MPEPAASHDDASLAQRIRSGDREALGALYDRYASVAMATALRVVPDREQAEDVVHDAFLTVWRKIDRFDPTRGALRGWLLTITRNLAIDRIRANRGDEDVAALDEQSRLTAGGNPTWDEAVRRLSAAELRAAIALLPEEQRTAIELAYFGGRTYREIAVLTGVPLGTANGRLRLALARLRATLTGGEAAPAEAVGRGIER
jgi:RNA polymerase sigma-70 factor, ECF subfamily